LPTLVELAIMLGVILLLLLFGYGTIVGFGGSGGGGGTSIPGSDEYVAGKVNAETIITAINQSGNPPNEIQCTSLKAMLKISEDGLLKMGMQPNVPSLMTDAANNELDPIRKYIQENCD